MRDGYDDYDPNGVGVANGNFLGLPRVPDPGIVLLPLPFAPTVSFGTGTENAPARILEASYQLDVCIPGMDHPWEIGFDWRRDGGVLRKRHDELHPLAAEIIARQEEGLPLGPSQVTGYGQLVDGGREVITYVAEEVRSAWAANALPVLVGGDHSTPLGAYQSLPEGAAVLQLDAHMDLRAAYEGFRYSHASVMSNILDTAPGMGLVQVGIRDYCPAEVTLAVTNGVHTFYAAHLHEARFRGEAFAKTIAPVLEALPQQVWLSLDVDVLDLAYCPHTGTPVPGGMSYAEVVFLVCAVLESGREIIGMDVVETGDHPLDANVSARLLYELACRAYAAK